MTTAIIGKLNFTDDIGKKLAVILGSYLVLMFLVFNVSAATLGKFFIINVFSILLPGAAILVCVGGELSRVGTFCMAYIFGYAWLVVEYFVSRLSAEQISFAAMSIISAVAAVLILYLKYKRSRRLLNVASSPSDGVEIVVFALLVLVNVVVYAGNHLGIDVAPLFTAHRDMQYWTNNTVALKLAWPPHNLFLADDPLTYHYFSGIPIAFLSLLFNIDVFTLSFPLYALTKAVIMFGGVYFLTHALGTSKKWTVLFYALLLFSTGLEKISVTTIYHHILLSPFGFDVGLAYGMVFVGFLLRQWQQENLSVKLWLGMLISWSMCVGAKAPAAVILMVLPGYMCVYWLYEKKWGQSLIYGLTILLMFFVIGKYCVGMFATAKGDTVWTVGLYTLENAPYMNSRITLWLTAYLGTSVKILIFAMQALVRTFLIHPAIIGGSALAFWLTAKEIRARTLAVKDLHLRLGLLVTAVVGIILSHIVNAGGSSEMYFAMVALTPLVIFMAQTAKDYEQGAEQLPLRRCRQAFAGLVVVSILFFWCYSYDRHGVLPDSLRAARNFYRVATNFDYDKYLANGIRREDVKALSWLRDNAAKTAVVMSDKAVMNDNARYYLYGIFCEHQQYLEGTDMLGTRRQRINDIVAKRKVIMRAVYANAPGAIDKAKAEGVNYIVQTTDVTPDFQADLAELELVTSSATMRIYRIQQ